MPHGLRTACGRGGKEGNPPTVVQITRSCTPSISRISLADMESENCFFVSGKSLKLVEATAFEFCRAGLCKICFLGHTGAVPQAATGMCPLFIMFDQRYCCAGTLFTSLPLSFTLWLKGGRRYSFILKRKGKKKKKVCRRSHSATAVATLQLGLG